MDLVFPHFQKDHVFPTNRNLKKKSKWKQTILLNSHLQVQICKTLMADLPQALLDRCVLSHQAYRSDPAKNNISIKKVQFLCETSQSELQSKVLHTGGPTGPMVPGDPDSPFYNEKKVAFTNTVKLQGHRFKKIFTGICWLQICDLWPLTPRHLVLLLHRADLDDPKMGMWFIGFTLFVKHITWTCVFGLYI